MSTITRTLTNYWRIGIKEYFHQMQTIGDTKAGTLVGVDRLGNKYFENGEELPLRTRWVDYKNSDYDASHIEPGWHAWLAYTVDKAPSQDPSLAYTKRVWGDIDVKTIPNYTLTRGAYKPYSTTKSKITMWEPTAIERK
ncbi:NDUFA12-domain-containing protein [Daldinia vernicosa]|uniref:NDUFA12-domain-containing protein n=1 Tax=Daldinia vernicosa TaxID=114800 RepID=UPI002007ACBA|nr:NDUFA12-domain-containing protein [Daldinia vernicosa]KAI0849111.1 NDUFA12-domain-containing protein [Daldinia vernicosa]